MTQLLITRERAQQNIAQTSFTEEEGRMIDHFNAAVADAIRRHCRRDFQAQPYDELHHGHGCRELLLCHFPVLAIERVSRNPGPVLEVTNSSSSNQVASVRVTQTGVELARIASGTYVLDTSVTFASYTTMTALTTAVAALGNGWDARLASAAYAGYPALDLFPQGAFGCRNGWVGLQAHLEDLSDFDCERETGCLYHNHPELPDDHDFSVWPGGPNHYRVRYTAGFEVVPESIQEAAAEWVAMLYWLARRDPAVQSEAVTSAGSKFFLTQVPPHLRTLLAPYRKLRV
jgi:hypothetical protein